MIPGRGLFVALAAWALTAALAVVWPPSRIVWNGSALAILALAWIDLRAARRRADPRVAREIAGALPLGVWSEVTLHIGSPDEAPLRARVFDHHPGDDDAEGFPAAVTVPGHGWGELRYRYRPGRRGEREFGAVEVQVDSPLRMWRKRVRAGETQVVRVYPNFAEVSKYALLATDDRLSQMGIRTRSRRGEGTEFHQLRDYHEGDSLRQIDWKATSRVGKLVSREYMDERDQQIVLLIDCGRRMLARDAEFSHFDHSLNSALLLTHVALRQGDLVGLQTFGGNDRFLNPGKGQGTLRGILNCVYDLEPALCSPDYLQVARDTMARVRKRSLVIMITNLRDEDAGEILPALQLLRSRHLVLLASLREAVIGDTLSGPVTGFGDALLNASVHRYLLGRRQAHDTIRRYGVRVLDVDARRLAVDMVNRYLDIKRSGVL